MATTYEQTTTTTASGPVIDISPDPLYVRSIAGILKLVEILLNILVLICASIPYGWIHRGGGWVQFVASVSLIATCIFFILFFLRIVYRIPAPWAFIEFASYVVIVFFYFIAAIVSAVYANYHSAIGACCFFAFAALAVYAVDLFFKFRAWRAVQHPHTSQTTTSGGVTTTTTTTTYETRTQY